MMRLKMATSDRQLLRIVSLDLGNVTPPADHPDSRSAIPIQAFAIDTPNGTTLVDTGLGEPHVAIDEMYRPVRRRLDAALTENNLRRDRIVAIIVSHLHFDHIGAIREFARIPIHVQRDELEAAKQRRYTIRSRMEAPELRYLTHEGDADIAEGIRLIATPGHTPRHQSVAIQTVEGIVILACQAAYGLEEWTDPGFEDPAGAASAWDRDHYRYSLAKLRAMNPVEVRFTHDRRAWRTATQAPV